MHVLTSYQRENIKKVGVVCSAREHLVYFLLINSEQLNSTNSVLSTNETREVAKLSATEKLGKNKRFFAHRQDCGGHAKANGNGTPCSARRASPRNKNERRNS